ncbi:MAG: WD40 repeat domain-containing protein, partial [Pirellulaceae bacterium]|nr:WD40 repeat domain-containing protein [Pirellulaceae bacterium]
ETHRQALVQHQQSLEKVTAAGRGETLAATFDARSRQVLLIAATGHGALYSTGTGQPVAVLQPPTDAASDASNGLESIMTATTAQVAVTVDQIATIRTDQRTWQWNLDLPWELVQTWGNENDELFSARITALAFSPDDRNLAVGSGPPSRFGDLKELDVATGAVQRDYGQVHSDTILAIEYSPDGKWLATAGADKLCRLHDPQTGAMVKILEGHTHFVQSLTWQDQAQQLATASADKTVKVWDVETGERRQSITGFGKEISAIAYVGDSEQLVSVSLDGHTRLHRGDNAQLVRNYAHNPQPLYTLALSPDGKRVLVGDHDGKIRIYQVEDAQLIRQWPE